MQPMGFVISGQGLNGCGSSLSIRGGPHQGGGRPDPTSVKLVDRGGWADDGRMRHWGHCLSS